jgi:hypothetical protein
MFVPILRAVERGQCTWGALPPAMAHTLVEAVRMLHEASTAQSHPEAMACLGLLLLEAGTDCDLGPLAATLVPSGHAESHAALEYAQLAANLRAPGSPSGGWLGKTEAREKSAAEFFGQATKHTLAAAEKSAEALFQLGYATSFGDLGQERCQFKALEW